MRIIAGEFRSRKLLTPRDDAVTRPIPDRAKESLFGLLRGHCEGARVFDGFAGTGALGLEAISRGAERCVFVEKDKGAAELLRRNIEALGAGDRCEVIVGDALGAGALARAPRPLTLAFLDPPYPLVREPVGWARVKAQLEKLLAILTDDGFAVVRTPWPFSLEVREATGDRAEPPKRPRHRKKPKPEAWSLDREEWERWSGRKPIEDVAEPEAEEPAADPVTRVRPELSVPGATGPETHVYHTTAVHLYARKRHESTGARGHEGDAPGA
jgi:16S rRNA (guanine(966)-N(2))-methyltransferase RsmD